MSTRNATTTWKQACLIWIGTNVGGCANFLFAFPGYHVMPNQHWWLLTGIAGIQIAILTLSVFPIDYLAFQRLLLLRQRWARQFSALVVVISFTGLAWILVSWWFSGWISYTDNSNDIVVGYFLASLLMHAFVHQESLILGKQSALDGPGA